MPVPAFRKPPASPPADEARELPPGGKRFDIDELLPPHDCGPWPEGLTLTRENGGIVSDRF